ncbi:MAG: glycerol-3-phosphate 1-O-acyltransferase PlsY [Halocynthiibacter sp.]
MPEIVTSRELLGLVALLGYLLGSVPFGILVARAMGLGDLRNIGSGNIGATNVLRTGNKSAALLTLLFDGAKGGVAVLAARALLGEDAAQLAGLAAFVGHIHPVWLGFRGGKGVATFLGILLALNPLAGVAACASWLVVAAVTRTSSLAALMSVSLVPIWLIFLNYGFALALVAVLTVLIYLRHIPNIRRLRAGTEPKIGQKN